jgi:dUTP pyrophosphatase
MQIKFKKLTPEAVIPQRANPTDAGLDLVATSMEVKKRDEWHTDGSPRAEENCEASYIEYGTGLAVEIPEGYVGMLFPRSSITKKEKMLKNSVGVIDSGYRGEIKARFMVLDHGVEAYNYSVGDKIAQLLIVPIALPEPVEADELSDTSRGEGGFGSTGN